MPVRRLDEIVARFGGDLAGAVDGSAVWISGIATLEGAGPEDLSFLTNPKYRGQLAATRAAAVILAPDALPACPVPAIVTANPYLYFARVAGWLHAAPRPDVAIHPSASVARSAVIGKNVVIEAHCSIGEGAVIGDDSWLHANVSVYAGCRIGARAIIHSGAVIGSDGFGFARESNGSWVKIPQIGRVLVGDDVEIGANTTIDRGALEDTVIEDGVKLDNQIQVAHNVRIGAHTAMAGCVGVAGSAKIGRRCTVGGGAVILGHLTLADDVNVSAGTLVGKSIPTPGTYTGTVPFLEHGEWLKNFARLRHLDAMADKIRALETRLAELEKRS
ncbi:MAG: UDP-3-O-(3-hydroxymyristoyl)glucosamine N-acyltransferase [Candidatus Nitricoxidivorans perseverans]|uniref:UDP-3-O-acylglucosamine N-acyltransferase n=1 Tax=Candidatus Nitricoxidivorans perseverans TaxID=2975601 RepID=A0AA49FN08_9PROT|nr:MAG: UDP-3-O-(3-hydroxymyristoyl)glucosamine N-acyltransferase [Candidatus Nitricoxidivorans perseverans]